jgi:hypothetical protein
MQVFHEGGTLLMCINSIWTLKDPSMSSQYKHNVVIAFMYYNKTFWILKINMVINFHEFEMIHGWYALIPPFFFPPYLV